MQNYKDLFLKNIGIVIIFAAAYLIQKNFLFFQCTYFYDNIVLSHASKYPRDWVDLPE